jgi:putative hydroxymethylpyrimidine transport system substrate-binding protein
MRLVIRAGLAAVLLLVAAPQPRAQEATDLTLILDWFMNPDHAPLVVAQQRGYFADAGLDVTMREPADPNNPPKLVAAGKADIAISYQPQLHLQVDQDLPLQWIGTLIATPLNTVLALEDGPIDTLKDLEGRKVGYSVGGFEEAVLGTMLEQAGVAPDAVELVNVNFSLSPALLSGRVAAVVGAYRNFELNQLEIEGAQGRAFYPEEHGVPSYDELIFIAREDRADDPALRRFIDAVARGTQYLINHPDASYELFVDAHPDLDDALNRKAWTDTLPRFALRPAALDTERYREFAAFLNARGLIGDPPPVDTYATELPAARPAGE